MNIDKVKLDHGIVVDYSTINESFRIDTGDEPKMELFAAAGRLIYAGLMLFGFSGMQASLHMVEVSHGEEPGSKLTLRVQTTNGEKAKIVCPKVDRAGMVDWSKGGERIDHPQNDYNDALEGFLLHVEEFVRGKRLQMALPFDAAQEDAEGEDSEGQAVADRVMAFPGR